MPATFRTEFTTSVDGTRIAMDVVGSGPPLILVGGAFSFRRWKGFVRLAAILAPSFTVHGYDRRGRGDSGAGTGSGEGAGSGSRAGSIVEQEIADLAAVARHAGDPAHVFGMSSGGVLALRATAGGLPARSLTVYQPPFAVSPDGHVPPADFGPRLAELIAADRRSAAVHYFMTTGMGAPPFVVRLMRLAPFWKALTAVAHTLPTDHAVMGDTLGGRPLDGDPWRMISAPTLVLDGSRSPAGAGLAADQLADRLPNADRRTLASQGHNVAMPALADAIATFASGVDASRR
ncbi:MAG TPA: alpha/beta hydrolase [Jiangellaceae bacterium]